MTDDLSSRSSADSWDAATRQVHLPLGMLLLGEYAPALQRLGLLDPLDQKLGRGGFGVAYKVKLHGTSVLKLTRDPMEVLASWALRGRQTSHIVPIFNVWSLGRAQRYDHWASWWVIHRGYLNEFAKRDGDLLETIYDFWKDDNMALSLPRVGTAGRAMREKWRAAFRHDTTCSPMEVQRALVLLDHISIAVREMGSVHIDWTDILPDNLMRDREGNLRISDVGFGRPRRHIECEPPELTLESAEEYTRSK